MEPWSADDPWQERRDPSPGWDAWSSQAPTADEYAVDEPEPPASDPWAESWTDEVAGIPESPSARELDGDPYGLTDGVAEPPPAASEPPPAELEPEPEPPSPVPLEEPEPYAAAEPTRYEPARIEPWSPDPDPWGAAWTMPPAVEEAPPEEPSIEPEAPVLEPSPDADAEAPPAPWQEPEAEPEPDEPVVAAVEAAAEVHEPEAEEPPLAAVEPEEFEPEAEEPPVAVVEAAAEVHEPEADELPLAAVEAAADEPEPEEPPLAAVEAAPEEFEPAAEEPPLASVEAAPEEFEPAAEEPPLAAVEAAAAEFEPKEPPLAPVEVAAEEFEREVEAPAPYAWETDVEPPLEPEPEPLFVPPLWTSEPFPQPADEPATGAMEAEPMWEADLWAEPEGDLAPMPSAVAVEPEPGAVAEPVEEAPAALTTPSPDVDLPTDEPWPRRIDPTEVLPTTWAPAPPQPAEAEREPIEPRTGDIRTILGRAEPQSQLDLDDELAEEPNTAEQAVPWLIGVILLLAGMVIVLLALIFAGDASLGGTGGSSPSPTAALVGANGSGAESPAPSPTREASPTPSASASPEPSESPAVAGEYGELEMVYQGRSAALAPIYLLRRDFTVEGEPDVLAQDANLDVRRFAWSADGTRGAFLYADLLVGIDPGVDIHRLSDGIGAITFGDDAETVYAVRLTADGDNDVATILSVDQASGAEQELDRVTYPRPVVGDEAALAEAQFTDDGGSARLYWMHDGTLRLWILGAGAWTIDPADGNASRLEDDALPVQWSPDGERRVRLAVKSNTTTLRVLDRSGDVTARATVDGRVSHLRWSPRGDQVVFTLGRSAPAGGVLQDLFLWNLGEGEDPAPTMITNTGAAFGAEWLGSQARWEEP